MIYFRSPPPLENLTQPGKVDGISFISIRTPTLILFILCYTPTNNCPGMSVRNSRDGGGERGAEEEAAGG